jgi:hypothetical protein
MFLLKLKITAAVFLAVIVGGTAAGLGYRTWEAGPAGAGTADEPGVARGNEPPAGQGDGAGRRVAPVARLGGVPLGHFGLPLGVYLTIEGRRSEAPKTGTRTLRVDTLNGKKLAEQVDLWVENIRDLPPDVRCVLKGYETGRMIGTPPAVLEAAREAGKEAVLPQPVWQFQVYFVAIRAVAPKSLKVTEGP